MKPNLLVAFSFGHCANDLVPIGMYILIPAFGTAMGLSPAEIGLLFMLHSLRQAYWPIMWPIAVSCWRGHFSGSVSVI